MKKLLLVCLAVVLFSGCRKLMEHFPWHPDPQPDPPPCRVDFYTSYYIEPEFGREENTHTFFRYDAKDNPISVKTFHPPIGVTAVADTFAYDQQSRLIFYGQGSTESYHTYAYEGNSLTPVRDTFYAASGAAEITKFVLDSRGRIVEEQVSQSDGTPLPDKSMKYDYDNNGNRQVEGQPAIEYLEFNSIFSLHRTWQIIFRNFSVNSSKAAQVFNQQDLPVNYSTRYTPYDDTFYGWDHPQHGASSEGPTYAYECE